MFVSQFRSFKTTDLVPVHNLHMEIPSSLQIVLCNGFLKKVSFCCLRVFLGFSLVIVSENSMSSVSWFH